MAFTHGFDAAHAAQALPFAAVGKPADVRALPAAAHLNAGVPFFHRLAVDQRGVAGGDGGVQVALDLGVRGALVALEGEHVVGVGLGDLAGDAPLAAHRVEGDDAVSTSSRP